MSENSGQQEFNLRDYWQILSRRRFMIYTCIIVTTVAAAVSSFMATPVYRASSLIAIERKVARLTSTDLSTGEMSWLDYQNWYNTQYRIIESREVLKRAVEILDLAHRPDVLPDAKEASRFSLGVLISRVKSLLPNTKTDVNWEKDPLDPYIKLVRRGLQVTPINASHLVEISYISESPAFAAEVANAVKDAYSSATLAARAEKAQKASAYYLREIANLNRDLLDVRQKMQVRAKLEGVGISDDKSIALKRLDDLDSMYTQAEIKAFEARSRLDSLVNLAALDIDDVRRDQNIKNMQREISQLETKLAGLETTYGKENASVRETTSTLQDLRQRMLRDAEEQKNSLVSTARQELRAAESARLNLENKLKAQRLEVDRVENAINSYQQLQLQAEQLQGSLEYLMRRKNDAQLASNINEDTTHNVHTVERAIPPEIIFKPKKKLNTALGFIFGLFLGIGSAVLMEYVDNTLKTPDDVRKVLGAAVLGMIPADGAAPAATTRTARRKERRGGRQQVHDPALVTANQPLSPTAEAYRELRTAVLLATPGHPPRDLTVTSCQPGEGKTTTSINLAVALGQLGRRVLLVDCDLRKPRCHQVLKVPAQRGVSTFLTGLSSLDGLVQKTEIENLSVLPSGPVPPNPAELLDSDRFRQLVTDLREMDDFDHVIFDSPPVLSVVDPMVIGRQTEGTVMVIKSAYTSKEASRLGRDKLEGGQVNLLGIVLNAVENEHVPYHYRYYRYGTGREPATASSQSARSKKVS